MVCIVACVQKKIGEPLATLAFKKRTTTPRALSKYSQVGKKETITAFGRFTLPQ